MNILMVTNTYSPHVGGVARSVDSFAAAFRRRGHRVLVVAPAFENAPDQEVGVIRIPAIQRFNGSDFSVVLPMPSGLVARIEAFDADIIHSHHPFLLGGTALRLAHRLELPLVFTHHTMYEQYTHYVPGDSKPLKRFVVRLSTSYANLCNQVFAPSESIATILRERGVHSPVDVVPTGVDTEQFRDGSGIGFRMAMGIPPQAFIVGHLGRLAQEKNLMFLAAAVAEFLHEKPNARFLVVGEGSAKKDMLAYFADQGVADRIHAPGTLQHPLLASAYKAMDVFAFASKSETQGVVLIEASAAGVPIVALDAPGAREVVSDPSNGFLIRTEERSVFVDALHRIADLGPRDVDRMRLETLRTAERFSLERTAEKALALYSQVIAEADAPQGEDDAWRTALRLIKTEWLVIRGMAGVGGSRLDQGETDRKAS